MWFAGFVSATDFICATTRSFASTTMRSAWCLPIWPTIHPVWRTYGDRSAVYRYVTPWRLLRYNYNCLYTLLPIQMCVFLKLTRIFTFCEHTKPPPCAALPVEPAVVRPQHNPCTDTDGRPRIQLWHTRCHWSDSSRCNSTVEWRAMQLVQVCSSSRPLQCQHRDTQSWRT